MVILLGINLKILGSLNNDLISGASLISFLNISAENRGNIGSCSGNSCLLNLSRRNLKNPPSQNL